MVVDTKSVMLVAALLTNVTDPYTPFSNPEIIFALVFDSNYTVPNALAAPYLDVGDAVAGSANYRPI